MRPTLTHVAIFARDIDASVAFYRRYARLHEVHRREEHDVPVVWLAEEGRETEFVVVVIGIPHHDAAEPGPFAHLGYAVASRAEVDTVAAAAREDGTLAEGPVDAGEVVGYYCILKDPDGNSVEFSYGQALGPQQG